MTRGVIILAVASAMAAGISAAEARAQSGEVAAPAGGPNACGILTREEVKKLVPWNALFDREKETEEPYGSGSLCSYPGVSIFLGKWSRAHIDGARKIAPLIAVPDMGDEAYLQHNGSSFVELHVKVGDRLVHVQKGIRSTESFDTLKPSVIALGKALVSKLR